MRTLLLAVSLAGLGPGVWAQQPADADQLYRERADANKLRAAQAIWEKALAADPRAFEPAAKLAQAAYFEGTHTSAKDTRMKVYLQGVRYAERAVALHPERPEGHFWLGVLNGVYARDKGVFKSLSMIRPIRQSFEKALKADPKYERGGPDRALGRFYFELPGILGGSKDTSLQHLQMSLKYAPKNTLTLLYLGDTFAGLGKKDEARKAYQACIDAPVDPDWVTEDGDNKALAAKALKKL